MAFDTYQVAIQRDGKAAAQRLGDGYERIRRDQNLGSRRHQSGDYFAFGKHYFPFMHVIGLLYLGCPSSAHAP